MSAGPLIGVIDYGMGNRRSVQKGLERTGARAPITGDEALLRRCHGLVLPGVGAFPLAMRNLRDRGLDELVRSQVAAAVPLLGICLGMQLLFERSEELEPTPGLALLPGAVSAIAASPLPVPHIGWNEVSWTRPSRLTAGLPAAGCPFYHVHSYAVRPADEADVVGSTDYGERFATVIEHDRVFGVQFHPGEVIPPRARAAGQLRAPVRRRCRGRRGSAAAVPARG